MTLTSDKCALIILDGWGIGDDDSSNAIAAAHTPFMDELLRRHPKATLRTDGEHVGLPDGQMGNSEVGHMNIGAGRSSTKICSASTGPLRRGRSRRNRFFRPPLTEPKAQAPACTSWASSHKAVCIPSKRT